MACAYVLAAVMHAQAYTWRDIVQPAFQDGAFVGKAESANSSELKKVSSDFALSYRFLGSEVHATLKEPFMVRLWARVEGMDLQYVENGGRCVFKIPLGRLSKKEDISNAPGKWETVLGIGILTPSLFESLYNGHFVQVDPETGNLVFDLTFKHPPFEDTSRQRVWVDGSRRYVTKRVWYAQDGRQMATFLYEEPQLQKGVWFPTKATVLNAEGRVAGVTRFESVVINSGLSSGQFQF